MVKVGVLIAALGALPLSAQVVPPSLDASGLVTLIRSNSPPERSVSNGDPFTTPIPGPGAGSTFVVEVPVVQLGQAPAGPYATWDYKLSDQALTLWFRPEAFVLVRWDHSHYDPLEMFPKQQGVELSARQLSTRRERMTNAFGVSATVTVRHEEKIGIATFGQGFDDPMPGSTYGSYSTEIQLAPEAARLLTASLVLRLEGDVVPLTNGDTVECGQTYHAPTLDGPVEVFARTCVASVSFSKISFVDRRDGAPVASWSR